MSDINDCDNVTKEKLLAEIAQLKQSLTVLEENNIMNGDKQKEYFVLRLKEEAARSTRYNYEFSVLLVQMDNLEAYSDKFKAEATAEVLGMLKTIINNGIRTTDLCFLFEPGKYAIILPYTSVSGARIVIERLRQTAERVFNFMNMSTKIPLSLSLAAASYPKDAVSSEHLVDLVNKALSTAQSRGGNVSILVSENEDNVFQFKSTGTTSGLDDILVSSIDDEVMRCSRHGQKFALLLILFNSLIEKNNGDAKQIKATIQQMIKTTIRTLDRNYWRSENSVAILLPSTDEEGAEVVSKKLLLAITDHFRHPDGVSLDISLNIGAASFPFDEISREGLLQRAETALAESIKIGCNNICMASALPKAINKKLWGVNEWVIHLKKSGPDAIYNMLASLDLTEQYARPHSQSVARYSVVIGQGMELSKNALRQLRTIALFHDIGKMCLPKEIITKPDRLSIKEWQAMLQHPKMGADILEQFTEFAYCARAVLSHHERWDGKGYPNGLKGDRIPVEARIISVAEALDDMVTPRPYKQHMPLQRAIEELKNNAGTQFDPAIVEALIKSAHKMQNKSANH